MTSFTSPISRSIWRGIAIAAAVAFAPLAANAGQCPANMVVPDGQGQQMNPAKAKGVTDTVLTRIDLAQRARHAQGACAAPAPPRSPAGRHRDLARPHRPPRHHHHPERHDHGVSQHLQGADRAPAGETTAEVKGTSHWWKNTGRRTVILLSADLFHDKDDAHMMWRPPPSASRSVAFPGGHVPHPSRAPPHSGPCHHAGRRHL